MKMKTLILIGIFWGSLFFLTGCEAENGVEDKPTPMPLPAGELGFTALNTRSGGESDSHSNLTAVPDTVGVFVNKTFSGTPTPVLKNAIYQRSLYDSGQLDGDGNPLFWYKTSDPAAYWDKTSDFDIYAYAPVLENANDYYTISDDGEVAFKLEQKKGILVDFIYASAEDQTRSANATNLHLDFKHKLCKIAFKLRNETENVVTCLGIRYTVEYPKATFNLLTDEWTFLNEKDTVRIERKEQYDIFSKTEKLLPELTTLLFPIDAINRAGFKPDNVVVSFEIALNNRWYNLTDELSKLNLEYDENRSIELTFNCLLNQGDPDHHDDENGVLWNIYQATFDSFKEGGSIGGILK